MPLPPPKRIDNLHLYFVADTDDVLRQLREQYKDFLATMRAAKREGDLVRMPREQLRELSRYSRAMRDQIFELEVAVTAAAN